MNIQTLAFKNLKGRSAEYALSPCTLIVGGNFTGKTAIIEACRLALIGYIPELGKLNSASFELSSGSRMETTLSMDTGLILQRSFFLEKGAVKQTTNIDPLNFATPLLDSSAYFAMSDTARVNYIFERVDLGEEYTTSGIIAALERVSFASEHTEQIEKAKTEAIALCRGTLQGQPSVALRLGAAELALKVEFAKFNLRSKDTIGAIRTLNELKNREDECSAVTLTDIRNQAERNQGLLAEANTALGRLTAQQDEAVRVSRRRVEISQALDGPAPSFDVPPLPLWDDPRPALKEQLAPVTARLDALPLMAPAIAEAKNDQKRDAFLKLGKLERDDLAIIANADKIKGEIAEIDELPCCPFCKGKAKGWKAKLVASLENQMVEIESKRDKAAILVATNTYNTANSAHEDYITRFHERQALTSQNQGIADAISKADLEYFSRKNKQQLAESAAKQRQASYEATQKQLTEELQRIQEVIAPGETELEYARTSVQTLRQEAADLATKLETAQRLQQDLRRASEAAEEHTLAAASLAVTKKLSETIKEMKSDMVEVAFKNLLELANNLCGDILPSPLAYQEGHLGRFSKSGFIRHSAFSGTEKALGYVAIGAALSAKAPFRLLIIDELGRLTDTVKARVLAKFSQAVDAHILDQVIAVLPLDAEDGWKFPPPAGWDVINTSEGAAV